jgi:hypothetical protein
MNNKRAAAILTALLYSQALLGVAGVVAVLLKDRPGVVRLALSDDASGAPEQTLIR